MSTTFSVSRDDIINRALRICGAYDATNPPNSVDYTNVSLAFNMMIKAWMIKGIPIWKIQTILVPMLANVNTYQIGPYATGPGAFVTTKIARTIYAFIRQITNGQNFDTPIDPLSFQEYNQYGAKQALGVVNSYMYQPLNDSLSPPVSSFAFVYPTPFDSSTTLGLIGQVVLNDVNLGTDPVDFPQECYMGMSWCLANEISMEYATSMDRVNKIEARAEKHYEELIDWSQENTDSVRFLYDRRGMY